jgi:hypothetical protein
MPIAAFEEMVRHPSFRNWWRHHPKNHAVRGRFLTITLRNIITGEPIPMTTLVNNAISNIPVTFQDAEGTTVPMPSSVPPTVTVDNTGAGTVAIGADNASVDFTPTTTDDGAAVVITLVATNSNGSNVTVTGNYTVGIAPDLIAVSGSFNDAGITTRALS